MFEFYPHTFVGEVVVIDGLRGTLFGALHRPISQRPDLFSLHVMARHYVPGHAKIMIGHAMYRRRHDWETVSHLLLEVARQVFDAHDFDVYSCVMNITGEDPRLPDLLSTLNVGTTI